MGTTKAEAGKKGGLAGAGQPKLPKHLSDMRKVWRLGVVQDGDREKQALARLDAPQRTLYGILKQDPKGFQKDLRTEEEKWKVELRDREDRRAEKSGQTGVGGGTVAVEARHMKVEDLLRKLMAEFEEQELKRPEAMLGELMGEFAAKE